MNPNFAAQATLERLVPMQTQPRLSFKYEKTDTLAALVRHVMAKSRPVDRRAYSIMAGEQIYYASEIEDLYNHPNFPRQ